VHLSTARQVAGVLERYFANAVDLVAIRLTTEALGAALRWETNSKGEAFPHLYGALPVAAAERVEPVPDGAAGRRALAERLA
jgi:uncharacterized protein (DUF952 family)